MRLFKAAKKIYVSSATIAHEIILLNKVLDYNVSRCKLCILIISKCSNPPNKKHTHDVKVRMVDEQFTRLIQEKSSCAFIKTATIGNVHKAKVPTTSSRVIEQLS